MSRLAPDVWTALDREWRSFDRGGSAAGVLVDIGWVALATLVALTVEAVVSRLAGRRPRRRIAARDDGPRLIDLLGLVAADLAGLAAFYGVFSAAQRNFFPAVGITPVLALFSANVLIRWRVVAVVSRAICGRATGRPGLSTFPTPRRAASAGFCPPRFWRSSRLSRSAAMGGGRRQWRAARHQPDQRRTGLRPLCADLVPRRGAAEALIRGRRSGGIVAMLRDGLARAWMAVALTLVAGLFVFFVAACRWGCCPITTPRYRRSASFSCSLCSIA